MAFQPVTEGLSVRIQYEYFDQLVENTLGLRRPGAPSLGELETIADIVRDHWVANVMPSLASSLAFTRVIVTDVRVENGLQALAVNNPPVSGGDPVAGLPGNVAFCVSFRTGLTGRSFRGRNYVVGITEADVTGNEVTPGFSAAILDAYNEINEALVGTNAVHSVFSRFSNGLLRPTALNTPVIAYLAVDLVVDSQRRRLTGRGR